MKKYILILFVIISFPVFATTMCSKNDAISVVLDPNATYSKGPVNTTSGRAVFLSNYGNVEVVAACLPDDEDTTTINAKGGEKTGSYAWIKMTHPFVTDWVYWVSFSSVSDCKGRLWGGGYYGSLFLYPGQPILRLVDSMQN